MVHHREFFRRSARSGSIREVCFVVSKRVLAAASRAAVLYYVVSRVRGGGGGGAPAAPEEARTHLDVIKILKKKCVCNSKVDRTRGRA